ncbi:MAG: sigma-54-dependent Fis family transcriptional regulator [Verrucomicrobiales bacterium]|nr:sigma-54-dependent Fis family transcriptional regulator [Verrucomicrobiales bacterium]
MKKLRVLVVETDRQSPVAARLVRALEETEACDQDHGIQRASTSHVDRLGTAAVQGAREWSPHIIALCLSPQATEEARAFLGNNASRGTDTPVLIAGCSVGADLLCDFADRGAADFVLDPFPVADLTARLLRLGRGAREVRPGAASADAPEHQAPGRHNMLGADPSWLREMEKIPQYAQCHASVLILGETGTGKELCARAIHQLGPRRSKPFAPLNCGAIPADLVENELFGHARGAFTSATSSSAGIVQSAEGGTLFLDEVDALPPSTQIKLLRFLQFREYRPVGSAALQHADVRVVAACNSNLAEAVQHSRVRADLFYRLNVLRLRLPPLRDRVGDLPVLVAHFLQHYAAEHGKTLSGLTDAARRKLSLHAWPGNVRELENVIERAVLIAQGCQIEAHDLSLGESEVVHSEPGSFKAEKARAIEHFEQSYLRQMLVACDGNISRAARAAQKNRRAFWELLRKHRLRIQPVNFPAPAPSHPESQL